MAINSKEKQALKKLLRLTAKYFAENCSDNLPMVAFLSDAQTDFQATENLNNINKNQNF